MAEHRTQLQILLDYFTDHPHNVKEQPRLERLLQAVIRDPRAALGQASCWPLGDVIIALQVPTGAALWTRDKDFAPLAQALDIPLYQLNYPRFVALWWNSENTLHSSNSFREQTLIERTEGN